NPALYAPERAVIDRTYAVLDNDRLWDALPLGDGATVERQALSDSEVAGLTLRAHRVVDCRGALGPGDHGPLQTAYGIVLGGGSRRVHGLENGSRRRRGRPVLPVRDTPRTRQGPARGDLPGRARRPRDAPSARAAAFPADPPWRVRGRSGRPAGR